MLFRIDLDRILENPIKPTADSQMPFCEFLVTLFTDMVDELSDNIKYLESIQLAKRSARQLRSTYSTAPVGESEPSVLGDDTPQQEQISEERVEEIGSFTIVTTRARTMVKNC